MFLESDTGLRTIVIGEEQEADATAIKRTTQILLRMARQMHLEKHFILIDQQLKKGLKDLSAIRTLDNIDGKRYYSCI